MVRRGVLDHGIREHNRIVHARSDDPGARRHGDEWANPGVAQRR